MLMAYTLKTSSTSPSSLNLAPIDDEIVTISSIISLSTTVKSLSVEGRISLPDKFQLFYMLAYSECNHFVRSKVRREIHCLNCNQHKMLVPRCHFELNITDDSGTITTTVSETLGERVLSMTAEQIYETVATKNESLPIAHIKQQLARKVFSFQLQKALFRIPDQKSGTLIISPWTEKEDVLSPKFPLSVVSDETSKKPKITPSTPAKKQMKVSSVACIVEF